MVLKIGVPLLVSVKRAFSLSGQSFSSVKYSVYGYVKTF